MPVAEPPTKTPLDIETRGAAVAAVEGAKARGWTQGDLKAWFTAKGVDLSDYLAARRGEPINDEVRGVLVMISITGLPDSPARDDEFSELPDQMRAARRWLLWKAEPNEDPTKKPRKVPYYASGERRYGQLDTPEDMERLTTLDAALAAAGDYTGLGFALGPDGSGQHWQGIDLDHLDTHPGLQFVADDLPGYTEKSPSGSGVHAIGYGADFRTLGSNSTGIEAYAHGRFFTVTGQSVGRGELECLGAFVDGRLAPLHSQRPQDTSAAAHEAGGTLAGAMAVHDLRSALASIRSDDRDLWIRLGHALKTLGEQGRGLFLEWSQTSAKYDAADAARVWDSFKPGATGFQAVFAEAQRQGWVNPASRRDLLPAHDPETGEIIEHEPEDDEPFSAAELVGEPPARRWLWDQWIPEGVVTSLYGDGGLGKTLLMQQFASAAAIGAKFLGQDVPKSRVLAVLCEDEKDELHRRQNAIKAAMGYPVGNPFNDLYLWPRLGKDNTLVRWNRDGAPVLTAFGERLWSIIVRFEPDVMVLDTLADFYGGNEIDRVQVNHFVKAVLGSYIARRREAGSPLSVILLGHPSVAGKASGGGGYSGSTAWNAAVRSRMYLSRPDEGAGDERILTRGKANYAASGDETTIRLFYADGVLHAQNDVEDGDSLLWAAMRDAVSLVDCQWRAGTPYNDRKGHGRFIHTALPTALQGSGFKPALARQATREVIAERKILASKSHGKSGYRSAEHAG